VIVVRCTSTMPLGSSATMRPDLGLTTPRAC
jgi:hypothetical protein